MRTWSSRTNQREREREREREKPGRVDAEATALTEIHPKPAGRGAANVLARLPVGKTSRMQGRRLLVVRSFPFSIATTTITTTTTSSSTATISIEADASRVTHRCIDVASPPPLGPVIVSSTRTESSP